MVHVKKTMKEYRKENEFSVKRSTRNSHLKRTYGITLEQFEYQKHIQGGRCVICQKEKPLVVDHDHETGKMRALLCATCNAGIGMLGDDYGTIRRAEKYVRKWAEAHLK